MKALFGNFGTQEAMFQININGTNKKHTREQNDCVSSKNKINTNALVLIISLSLIAIILMLLLVCFSVDTETTEKVVYIIKSIVKSTLE